MQKGFTLIELMVVVVIIGILSAIAIPTYHDYVTRAQLSEALTLSIGYKASVSTLYSEIGSCPTLTNMGFSSPLETSGKYVSSLSINPSIEIDRVCTFTFQFKPTNVSSNLTNKHLSFHLVKYSSGLGLSTWECTSTDINQKFLPNTCEGI